MTTHAPFDFENMPLTNEQKILATLERIEALLTPKEPKVVPVEPEAKVIPKSLVAPKSRK